MIDYVEQIVVPYVERTRELCGDPSAAALFTMDNFKGQITSSVSQSNNIHVCVIPPNVTDRLQPMDLSVNKLAKDFLKCCFEDWYA